MDGEAIIAALKMQEDQRAIAEGAAGIESRPASTFSAVSLHTEIDQAIGAHRGYVLM